MNIFVLSTDPAEAAKLMCDQHINKMILESAQLLSTCVSTLYKRTGGSPPCTSLYKPTHQSHPCSLWLLESKQNCDWLYQQVQALEQERQHRFDKWTPHQSLMVAAQAHFCLSHPSLSQMKWATIPSTAPRMALPLELQQFSSLEGPGYTWGDVVKSYQWYYQYKKSGWEKDGKQMTWTNRESPAFIRQTNAHA